MLAIEPSEAQKRAGNYAKHHVTLHGLPITIENRRGATRAGVGRDGKAWRVTMPAHYGYFKRSEGADGDHVDCYIGPHPKSRFVLVIDQRDADTKRFDEHKCMLGFANKTQALSFYKRGFSDGKGDARVGSYAEMDIDRFKDWLRNEDTTKRIARASGGRVQEFADGGTPRFDPDSYLAGPATPVAAPAAFDPDAFLKGPAATGSTAERLTAASRKPDVGILSNPVLSPITDIPREVYHASAEALKATGRHLNPFSAERRAAYERGESGILETGKGLVSALSVPAAPISGAFRSFVGHPLAEADEALRASATNLYPESKLPPALGYEGAKEKADTALMGMSPRGVTPVGVNAPMPVPAAPARGPLGVTLSEGQETGALPRIQTEQAALRGALGDAAQARAREFADQQRAQVEGATENLARELDPFGQRVAETPQEAGALVSEGVQQAARQRKAAVTQAYDEAKALPGEIHAGAFEGIGQKIKGELSLRDNPIVIDDMLTPFASRAIRDVENRISNLFIQNRADPFGAPNPENITGVSLRGVDQMRRRLSSFRNDAFASGNAADGRAARGVLEAFDNQVDQAVNGGLFRGDPRAIQAWNDARAAHADYRRTFGAGKNDPTGRVVEKILGKSNNPAAIPNDVADFLYGGTGVNPSSLQVNVTKRVRDILGEQSPEWSAVKQGHFSRLVEPPAGVTDFGPGKIAQRINRFLNGDGIELSREIYSPAERRLLQEYADLQRRLQVPQAGANWSNTSTILAPMLKKISGGIAGLVGAAVGHTVAPGMYGVGEGLGAMTANRVGKVFTDAKQLREISQQMPLVSERLQQWQRAVALATRANTPITQRTLGMAQANLAQSLQNLGLNPTAIFQRAQGLLPARSDQQDQQ